MDITAKLVEAAINLYADKALIPEPIPLIPDTSKPTPYPVDSLPSILCDAVKAISEKVKAPIAMAGQTVMSATVFLASTRADAENAFGQPMPLNTGFITLGDSGTRKSVVHIEAFLPIHNKEEALIKNYNQKLKQYEEKERALSGKELKDFRSENPLPLDISTFYSDATFEPLAGEFIRGKSIIHIDTDEGGQFFGGHSLKSETRTATIGGYIQLLDKGKVSRKRSRGNEDGSGTVFNRRLSIHLMAQEITVQHALSDPLLRGQGFLPRFFFTAPVSMTGSRILSAEEYGRQRKAGNEDLRLKLYWSRINEILATPEYINELTGDVMPPTMRMCDDAHDVWLEFYNDTEIKSGRFGEMGEISDFVSRVGDQARKLATSIAVFQQLDHVTGDCMRSAVALTQHSISEWLRYTKSAGVSPAIQDAVDVFEWLTLPTHKTPWLEFDANRFGKSGLNRFRPAKKRDAVLNTLLKNYYLLTNDGRNFRVNPKLLESYRADFEVSADNHTERNVPVADELRGNSQKCGSEDANKLQLTNPLITAESLPLTPKGSWTGVI